MRFKKPSDLADFFPTKRMILAFRKVQCGRTSNEETISVFQTDASLLLAMF
jgi:hypothetical protein